MEKAKQEKETKGSTKPVVWDCGSSLYDSFELKSFERKLDSAIASRTMSMPHLSDHRRRAPPPPPLQEKQAASSKKLSSSRISRSLQKFLRSVFRPKTTNLHTTGVYYVYDTSGSLSTIPEVPETVPDFKGFSPDMKSLVTRTTSDRFMQHPTSLGISCA